MESYCDLVQLNKQRNEWNNWLDDEATWKFVYSLTEEERFKEIMDYELSADFLPFIFQQFNIQSNDVNHIEVFSDLMDLLYRNLKINVSDDWIMIPLIDAELGKSIEINKSAFVIAGDRADKINEISHLVGIDSKELTTRTEHTENSRSPDFLHDPLLMLKTTHQQQIVQRSAESIAFYAVNFLNVLYWGHIFPKFTASRFNVLNLHKKRHINQHLVIQNINGSRWGHRPIQFDYSCKFELDWLNDDVMKERFGQLMRLNHINFKHNELSERFLRGIRFFVRAIYTKNNNRFFDMEADRILLLNIATECVLLQQNEELKSAKLKRRLARLGDLEDLRLKDRKDIIYRMTGLRGGYVHEGVLLYEVNNSSRNDKDLMTDLNNYCRMVARFLSKAYVLTEESNISASENHKDIEEWFDYLKSKS
nr:HEPN domain-containing protein [Paenibacillus sp. PAMC21692]